MLEQCSLGVIFEALGTAPRAREMHEQHRAMAKALGYRDRVAATGV